jgi:aspartate kinase
MKILKFGGTSVGSIEGILNVKRIVEAELEPVIVVVSAFSGITDDLYKIAKLATNANSEYEIEYKNIYRRHFEIIDAVVLPENKNIVTEQVNSLFGDLSNILRGIFLIKNSSAEIIDNIVSYGESISSIIIANTIKNAKHYNAKEFIKTNYQFNKHVVDFPKSNELIKNTFANINNPAVCGGFISTDDSTGFVTNLGRGGSDYTAAIIAAALDASILEIWTDVDGFMTADPRVISKAYPIEQLSFVEAMELCNFGAKVIYPPTIFPVYHKNIPIAIRNTFNPDAPGTYISRKKNKENRSIKGISSINDTALITMKGFGMVGVVGVDYRLFGALAEKNISVFFVSQASSENSISIGIKNEDVDIAINAITKEFELEINMGEINHVKAEKDLATVAIVGDNMKLIPGISGKLFSTLGKNGINVIAIAQGASETNTSFVIELKLLRKALNVIHESFFLSEYQELNIFLAGTGTVGGSLLDQIYHQQPKLLEQNRLKIKVVGIADEFNVLFDHDGIDLANYKTEVAEKGVPTTLDVLCNGILEMNIYNSIFVDCTASYQIAGLYKKLLSHNVSVVAANKVAASGDYETYAELKEISRKKEAKYLYETNVGAGLPIIGTISNLINSGDKILKMEAVLSGTLNFVFNTMSAEIPFSEAISMAKKARFSEPDPRIDLNGTDVIRKLVILSREAGYKVEQSDVIKNLFVPNKYFESSLDDFWNIVSELDAEFEVKRQRLEKEEKKFRFVAKMENGICSVALEEVDVRHPFYDLEGSNNIIMITTERYDCPMIIKGYGAGASVTAAGVFGDIISIANIR